MKQISDFFYSISSGRAALLALGVFIVFTATVLPQQAEKASVYSGDAGSPDASFFYSRDDLYQMAETYGEAGRSAYIRARFGFDVIWPLVYLFFLGTSLSWVLVGLIPEGNCMRFLNLFPAMGWLFDLLENIFASMVMANYPNQTMVVDALTPIFTSVKWVFVNGSFVILATVFLMMLWKRVRSS